eukprot:1195350-Prorocentrum_minimum.AAC.2
MLVPYVGLHTAVKPLLSRSTAGEFDSSPHFYGPGPSWRTTTPVTATPPKALKVLLCTSYLFVRFGDPHFLSLSYGKPVACPPPPRPAPGSPVFPGSPGRWAPPARSGCTSERPSPWRPPAACATPPSSAATARWPPVTGGVDAKGVREIKP